MLRLQVHALHGVAISIRPPPESCNAANTACWNERSPTFKIDNIIGKQFQKMRQDQRTEECSSNRFDLVASSDCQQTCEYFKAVL